MNKSKLDKNRINNLFSKFSDKMLKICSTQSQKVKALGISKTLWYFLVTGNDSEETIFDLLMDLFQNANYANQYRILYFNKMKKSLRKKELIELKNHFDDEQNLNTLVNWCKSP